MATRFLNTISAKYPTPAMVVAIIDRSKRRGELSREDFTGTTMLKFDCV